MICYHTCKPSEKLIKYSPLPHGHLTLSKQTVSLRYLLSADFPRLRTSNCNSSTLAVRPSVFSAWRHACCFRSSRNLHPAICFLKLLKTHLWKPSGEKQWPHIHCAKNSTRTVEKKHSEIVGSSFYGVESNCGF